MKLLILAGLLALAEGRTLTLKRLEKPCWNEKKCRDCDGRCVREDMVACTRDPCQEDPCGDGEKCVANYCGECSACCLEPKDCDQQPKVCGDGSEIHRDPFNNCRFPECPTRVCTQEVKTCPDGSSVSRDLKKNCAFPECPVPACVPKGATFMGDHETCTRIDFICKEGFEHWFDVKCGCGCKPKEDCPKGQCPDCEGKCIDQVTCIHNPCLTDNGGCAADEECVGSCGCFKCGCKKRVCTEDAFICPDGSSVSRDPANNCEFPKCPSSPVCPLDVRECADGSFVSRDPKNNCEFPECPTCSKGQCKNCDGKCVEQINCLVNPCTTPANGGCAADELCVVDDCGCTKCGCEKRVCTADAFICPDGSSLSRDPANNCEFPKCPSSPVCPLDVRECADGSFVSRDPKNNCEFPECPVVHCTQDAKLCPDGSFVSRDPKNNCEFPECPTCSKGQCKNCDGKCVEQINCLVNPCTTPANGGCAADELCVVDDCGCTKCGCEKRVCTADAFICPDGSSVSRDPANNCEFPKCPSSPVCPLDAKLCPNGKYVSRNPKNNCEFNPCVGDACTGCNKWLKCASLDCPKAPGSCYGCCQKCVIGNDGTCTGVTPVEACPVDTHYCTQDAKLCPDGSFVSRDPKNNCEFPKCPSSPVCPLDVRECADGSFVSRDPKNNCEFPECPVVHCTQDAKLCPDGSFVSRDPKNNCEFPECPTCSKGQCKNCDGKCVEQINCLVNPCTTPANGGCAADELCVVDDCGCTKCGCEKRVCTADAFICPDGSSVSRDPANNCEFPKCPSSPVCPLDVRECADGSFVSRDPKNNCEFPECPVVHCTQDAKLCPDGSFVSRDPKNNCEFRECPTCSKGQCKNCDGKCVEQINCLVNPCTTPANGGCAADELCVVDDCGCTKCGCEKRVCTADAFICPDGSSVSRDPANNCEFPKCPSSPVCPLDAKLCPNGKYVSRNPKNNCEFNPCVGDACTGCNKWLKCASLDCPKAPGSCYGCCQKCVIGNDGTCTGVTPVEACPVDTHYCTQDAKLCPDGSFVSRDPKNNCEFPKCPSSPVCPLDVRECADGSFVSRDPKNNCEFPECPVVHCTQDAKLCPDGSFVSRDPKNNCEFPECPTCSKGQCKNCDGKCVEQINCLVNPCTTPANGGCAADELCVVDDCGCTKCGCEKRVCTADAFICPDGSSVSRDPANNCEFPKCPSSPVCPLDVRECADGSFVSRDPKNNCEFPECPVVHCTQDAKLCPDGSFVSRDPKNNCEFRECPTCSKGQCKNCDGKCVEQINCLVNPCTTPANGGCAADELCVVDDCGCTKCGCEKRVCTADAFICPDGSSVSRDPANNCEFPKCPSSPVCPLDAKLCPNGKYVSRNPKNNCEFNPCVGDACTGCNKWLKCASLDCPKAPGSCYGCCQKCVIGNDGTCTGVTPVEACPVDTH